MPYKYEDLRPEFFTPQGNETLEAVRRNVAEQLMSKPQFIAHEAMKGVHGDTWLIFACLERLVELGELVEVTTPPGTWGQNQIYARPPRKARNEQFGLKTEPSTPAE